MEAVNYITQWTRWLIPVVPVGAAFIVTYNALRRSFSDNEGEVQSYDKKIKNTIFASVIAVTIATFIEFIKSYFM